MKIELHIEYFEEDGAIVALCPELQVSSFGATLKEAEKSVKEALDLFLEGCETLGTINEVLEESGRY
jgi:predicted RNase H-like HicB family nuclease